MRDRMEPGLVRAFLGGEGAVARLQKNTAGRDFVVGDIHGMFLALEAVLDRLAFRPDRDRLFSVGDLIDRGPHSALANDWIRNHCWFHAVRGNHDQMLLDAVCGPEALRPGCLQLWIEFNGGRWWLETGKALRRSLVDAMASLPLAAEIECDCGRIGVVHADIPPDQDWNAFLQAMRCGVRDDAIYALWSRTRLSCFLNGMCTTEQVEVPGIDWVVSGHVPTETFLREGNRWWIDTGAAYSGWLAAPSFALLQVHPGEPEAHSFCIADLVR